MDGAAAPVVEPPADGGRDWSELPPDALSLILTKVGAVDVLMGAGLVCRSWLDAAKVPDVWRSVDMVDPWGVLPDEFSVARTMTMVAVDRSGGQLRMFAGILFVADDLLEYIVERSPSLTDLHLSYCDDCDFTRIVRRKLPLPQLRSLHLDHMFDLTAKKISAFLDNCPRLELLVVRSYFFLWEKHDLQALAEKCAASGVTFDCEQKFIDDGS